MTGWRSYSGLAEYLQYTLIIRLANICICTIVLYNGHWFPPTRTALHSYAVAEVRRRKSFATQPLVLPGSCRRVETIISHHARRCLDFIAAAKTLSPIALFYTWALWKKFTAVVFFGGGAKYSTDFSLRTLLEVPLRRGVYDDDTIR